MSRLSVPASSVAVEAADFGRLRAFDKRFGKDPRAGGTGELTRVAVDVDERDVFRRLKRRAVDAGEGASHERRPDRQGSRRSAQPEWLVVVEADPDHGDELRREADETRAALDQQQPYLADQMHRAMSGTIDSGDPNMPSLRHVLLTSVIPAYLGHAIDDNVTWILALPMIEASSKTVADLLYDTNFESEDGVAAAIEQVGALLSSVQKSLAPLVTDNQRLSLPQVLKTAAAMLNLCHASVVFANHVQRTTKQATTIVRQLRILQNQANRIEEQLITPDDFFDFIVDDVEDDRRSPRWPDTYEFSERHVKQSMASDWSVVDERYFVKRGNGSKEVNVQVDGYDVEKEGLLEAIGSFRSICRRQATRGRRSRGVDHAFGMEALMI